MIIDDLIEKIIEMQNPACVGLDTAPEYTGRCEKDAPNAWASAIYDFNQSIIRAVHDVVPAVKVQIAYYEALAGIGGMECFRETCAYAKRFGLIVIADCKRNDIGSTAEQYAKAYFERKNGWSYAKYVDFLTVNGYLGTDGVAPFVDAAKENDKGIFALVKTSNPSSGELQNRKLADGRTVYECMGDMVEKWGEDSRGKYGYSRVGAVVGATYPEEAKILRERMPHSFFLIPGYGAQGANAAMLKNCFRQGGMGGVVNNSRGILCAWQHASGNDRTSRQAEKYARAAALKMKEDLLSVLGEIHA